MTDKTTPNFYDLLSESGYSDQEIVEHSMRVVCSAFVKSNIEETFVKANSKDGIIGFAVQIKPLRDKS